MQKIAITAIMAGLALAGCQQTYTMKSNYDSGQFDSYDVRKKGDIKGEAFLRQQGGGIVTCAGQEVGAMPYSHHTKEAANAALAGYREVEGFDAIKRDRPDLIRQERCDKDGEFSFQGLPEGKWIVVAVVAWKVGYYTQGGVLAGTVNVQEGEVSEIVLNDQNRKPML